MDLKKKNQQKNSFAVLTAENFVSCSNLHLTQISFRQHLPSKFRVVNCFKAKTDIKTAGVTCSIEIKK